MTKLLPARCCLYCVRLHAGLVSSATASEHRGTARVKRQTGLVSGDLGGRLPGDREQSRTRSSMPIVFNVKVAISLIFTADTLTAVAVHVCLPSCPGRARMCDGWRRQCRVTQAELERKPNEIRLWINNRLIQFG